MTRLVSVIARAAYPLATTAIVASFVLLGFIGFRIAVPSDLIQQTGAIKVRATGTSPIEAGRRVYVQFPYCKERPAQSVVGFYLASQGYLIPVAVMVSALPEGCHQIGYILRVPEYTPSSYYKLYMTREYAPNILERRTYVFESEPFTVVNPNDTGAP